jgi:uncharacterized protein YkwD
MVGDVYEVEVYICPTGITQKAEESNVGCSWGKIDSKDEEDGTQTLEVPLKSKLLFDSYVTFGEGEYEADGITYHPIVKHSINISPDSVQYIKYMRKDGDSDFICSLCPPDEKIDSPDSVRSKLLAAHNDVRAEYLGGLYCPLSLNDDLNTIAQWYADHCVDVDTPLNITPHMDTYGRTPQDRFDEMIGKEFNIGENTYGQGFEEEYDPNKDYEDVIDNAMQGWILSPHHLGNIIYNDWTMVGFGYAYSIFPKAGKLYWRLVLVADFGYDRVKADGLGRQAPLPHPNIPDTIKEYILQEYGSSCISACAEHMSWNQLVDIYGELTTKILVSIPLKKCCNIIGVELEADILGVADNKERVTILQVYFDFGKAPIPEDQSLQWLLPDSDTFGIIVDVAEHNILPGGYLIGNLLLSDDSTDVCKKITTGISIFETKCLTSGVINSGCLVDNNDNIISESDFFDKDKHISNFLRYMVYFHGGEFMIKPSDFTSHEAGDLVIIVTG